MPHDPCDARCLATAPPKPAVRPIRRPRRLPSMALLFTGLLGAAAAQADLISVANPPPQLLQYASPTPSVASRAFATTTFYGTLRASQGCNLANAQAWACRKFVDRLDPGADTNYASQATNTPGATASVSRGGNAFDTAAGFADYQVPIANSRAQSDYGSNKAEALARYAGSWDETRVESTNDSTLRTEEDFTGSAGAGASSVWADAFTTAIGGPVTFVFSVKQHQATTYVQPDQFRENFLSRDGDGFGEFLLQLFTLDRITTYGDGERNPFIEGFELLTQASLDFDTASPDGTQFLSLAFDAAAGGMYSLVSLLQVEVNDNARLDLFGTASLERIEVGDGQHLTFASGSSYRLLFPNGEPQDPGTVPEPATLALLTCASLAMGATHRRRQKRDRAQL